MVSRFVYPSDPRAILRESSPSKVTPMKSRLTNYLSRLALVGILILGVNGATALAQQSRTELAAPQPTQSDPGRLRQETFEIVWKTVNQRFYDPKFGGVDWQAVHERYAPL